MRKVLVAVFVFLFATILWGDVWVENSWNTTNVSEMSGVQFIGDKLALLAPDLSAISEQTNLTTISAAEEIGALFEHDGNLWTGSANPAKIFYTTDGWNWIASDEVPNASTDTRIYGIASVNDSVLIAGGIRGTGSFVSRSYDALNYGTTIAWDDSVYLISNCGIRDVVGSDGKVFAVTAPDNVLYSAANDGKIYISDDEGLNFSEEYFGGNAFYDIVEWGKDTLIFVGDTLVDVGGGTYYPMPMIAITTDNGATFSTVSFSTVGVDYFAFAGERIDDNTLLVSTYPGRIYAITDIFGTPVVEERDTLDMISDPDTTASDIIVTRIYKASDNTVFLLDYSESSGTIEYTKVFKTTDGGYTLEEVDSLGGLKCLPMAQDARDYLYIGNTNGVQGKLQFYGYQGAGYFISAPKELDSPLYNNVVWAADSANNRFYYAEVRVRTASDSTMSDAVDWNDIDAIESGASIDSTSGYVGVTDEQAYVQYKVDYVSTRKYISPIFNEISIDYNPSGIENIYSLENANIQLASEGDEAIFYITGMNGYISLDIYDITGRKVDMFNGNINDGDKVHIRPSSKGIYIYHLSINGKDYTGKFTIVK